MDQRFYTVAEAAHLLRLSEPTLYRAIRNGEFPAVKIRGRYTVPAKAIDQAETDAMTSAPDDDPNDDRLRSVA
ncbi:excisionase family DNA binding protein [Catenuloplanes nepalensis]|uniref:Excisionase family DNA binding protein n=1 Tax=Catenuloplanes nepalensis TaxID=587533 RepID=A0ABT9N6Z2_9ACTN|nr:helix-turn-helix domain-containing protein [Catenuloplanes nepalensis]MDP9799026.1 excisionase family DNA binding protein [Catenuloplanes nepalensis]